MIREMRRFPAILLLFVVTTVGSGAARYVHEIAHAHATRAEVTHGHLRGHGHHNGHDHHAPAPGDEPAPAPHDESNCRIHALLKLPMLGSGFVPILVCLGVFVAYLTMLPVAVRSRRPLLRLDSRGPPAAFIHVRVV